MKLSEKRNIKGLFNNAQLKSLLKEKLLLALFLIGCLLFWELSVHFLTLGAPTWEILFTVVFSLSSGCFIALLCSLFKGSVNKIILQVIMVLLTLIYASQYIYYCIFGSFFSLSQMGTGGDAITSFWDETLIYIGANILQLILLFVPLIVFEILLNYCKIFPLSQMKIGCAACFAGATLLIHGLCLLTLLVDSGSFFSYSEVYFSNSTDTDRSVEILGILNTGRLELEHMLFGSVENELDDVEINLPGEGQTSGNQAHLSQKEYNIIEEIDFNKLGSYTNSKDINILNNYFATRPGTAKNEYSGLFKDYNLITICAESFSPYLISKELTPTLYKLSHEGIIFNNFYNSYLNNTTNGEYALCMGIFPDLSRGKSESSFSSSAQNYLPFCLGNVFNSAGAESYAYHNHVGSYYNREKSHPNMGYVFKSADNGLTFTTPWPTSDLEMMEQSVDDYIHKDRFHAYYMTFSGHLAYDFEENPMSMRNRNLVNGLDYSDTLKAYIACNLELEKALTYLLERLEKEGIADKTVIVLSSDHYPYGISTEEFAQLSGIKNPTKFDKCKSSFICWTGGLEQPIVNNKLCCSVDILPTLLNLFGFSYDSRMLAGVDVFSDSPHIAVLNDRSFVTDLVRFDSSTGEIVYFDAAVQYPQSYIDNQLSFAIKTIKTRMAVSSAILNNDYYRFVYENLGLKQPD